MHAAIAGAGNATRSEKTGKIKTSASDNKIDIHAAKQPSNLW